MNRTFAVYDRSIVLNYPCELDYICHPLTILLRKGIYKVELWGAGKSAGGGYSSGILNVNQALRLFAFIGGQGTQGGQDSGRGGFNGGGSNDVIGYINGYPNIGGDGASDLRLNESGDAYDSRIIVAGGAGGGGKTIIGGYGGGIKGGDGNNVGNAIKGMGANQTHGGDGFRNGLFGVGASSTAGVSTDLAGCGGGGYFGGGSGHDYDRQGSGGGGSSYISGHPDCVIHTSKITFQSAKTIPGNSSMPNPRGGLMIGNKGRGVIRISPMPFSKHIILRHHISKLCIIPFIHLIQAK